jgi:AcrR family transcriptional regulator
MLSTRSEDTIAGILHSAATLFVSRNYADVSMDDIARESGVTKGALYHHFVSKEDLYLAMMHGVLEEKKLLFTRSGLRGDSCAERLRNLTQAFFTLSRREQRLLRLVRRDARVFKRAHREELIRSYQAAVPGPIEDVLRAGMNSGEIAPADSRLLAWHFVAMVEVILTRHADTVYPDDGTKLDAVLSHFLHGAAA